MIINRRNLLASLGLALPAMAATAAFAADTDSSMTAPSGKSSPAPKTKKAKSTHHTTTAAAHKPATQKNATKPKAPTPS